MLNLLKDLREGISAGVDAFRDERAVRKHRAIVYDNWLKCAGLFGHDWKQEDAAGQQPGRWLYRCSRCDIFEWASEAPSPDYCRRPG